MDPTVQHELAAQDSASFEAEATMQSELIEEDPDWEKLFKLKIFNESVQLINTTRDLTLKVEEAAVRELASIDKELNVIAITGLYRTGKSVLLNQLMAGQRESPAFGVGHATSAMTSGIWGTCVRHPVCDDQVLLLLDTEGLGDIKKGEKNHDNKIFTIATLLSSVLIYNIMGPFNQDALEKLTFITQQSQNVVLSTKPENEDRFIESVFPTFVLCMRDFYLDLEGRTPRQYLEECLENKYVDSETTEEYNKLRRTIRKYFKKRECFKFCPPTEKHRDLKLMDSFTNVSISEEFQDDLKTFKEVALQIKPKLTLTGEKMTGKVLEKLVRTYVQCIHDGAIPSVGDAMMVVVDNRNRKLIDDTMESFIAKVKELQLPEDDPTLLDNKLRKIQNEEIKTFEEEIIFDQNKASLNDLKENMKTERAAVVKKHESILYKQCIAELERLHEPISRDVDRGLYAHKMGYEAYQGAVRRRDNQFRALPEKFGGQKDAALKEFKVMKEAEDRKVKADVDNIRKEDKLEDDLRELKQELKKLKTELSKLEAKQGEAESNLRTELSQLKEKLRQDEAGMRRDLNSHQRERNNQDTELRQMKQEMVKAVVNAKIDILIIIIIVIIITIIIKTLF